MDAVASEGARMKIIMKDAGVEVMREPFLVVNLHDFTRSSGVRRMDCRNQNLRMRAYKAVVKALAKVLGPE